MLLDENYNLQVVPPRRRKLIEKYALAARKNLEIPDDALYIDVLSILEFRLQSCFCDDITFAVPDEWYRAEEAYYDAKKNVIYIRADVYDRAVAGDGRARFTIMHEMAHYILFKLWGLPYMIPLANIAAISDATLQSMDPEWQADTFAGAFLCRRDLVSVLDAEEIRVRCGVSKRAAETAYNCSRGIPYRENDFADFPKWPYIPLKQKGVG